MMLLMAEEGIRVLAADMIKNQAQPDDIGTRSDRLYGAWLCGTVLGNVGMALHYKLCLRLGGSFNLSHAATHTIVLPHAIAYNQSAAPALSRICRAVGVEGTSPGAALFDLSSSFGAPTRLKDLGLTEADLDRATDIALATPTGTRARSKLGPAVNCCRKPTTASVRKGRIPWGKRMKLAAGGRQHHRGMLRGVTTCTGDERIGAAFQNR